MENYYDRIEILAKALGYSSVNDFAINGLKYKSSQKLNRLKKKDSKPSVDIIHDITNKFKNINLDWLIKNKGEIFVNSKDSINDLSEPKEDYKALNETIEGKIANEVEKRLKPYFDDLKKPKTK